MAKEEMRNCPFCGRKVAPVYPWLHYFEKDRKWSFNHFCETDEESSCFCVNFVAKTKKEIINRWNGKFN